MIPDKVVMEAYTEIKQKNPSLIPSVNSVRVRILYNMDAKTYDIIYGLKKEDITDEEIIKYLFAANLIFRHDGQIFNESQTSIISV